MRRSLGKLSRWSLCAVTGILANERDDDQFDKGLPPDEFAQKNGPHPTAAASPPHSGEKYIQMVLNLFPAGS